MKPIYKMYIKDKPIHCKINKIINNDKTYMSVQENTFRNLNYVKKLILTVTVVYIFVKVYNLGLCFKINKLSIYIFIWRVC